MWFVFALLSAIFAALTSILAKIGIEGVNSNLATAIRTVVVVLMADGVFDEYPGRDFQYREKKLIDKLSVVITLMLAFIFLHEKFTPKSIAGCVLIGAGTLLVVL